MNVPDVVVAALLGVVFLGGVSVFPSHPLVTFIFLMFTEMLLGSRVFVQWAISLQLEGLMEKFRFPILTSSELQEEKETIDQEILPFIAEFGGSAVVLGWISAFALVVSLIGIVHPTLKMLILNWSLIFDMFIVSLVMAIVF